MRLKHLFLLLLQFTLQGICASGYELSFEKIDYLKGLSGNNVNCVYQDETGYIWIGTDNGLNKYDGHQFTLFNTDVPKDGFLSNGSINVIYQDKNGLLWIGTSRGLNCLNPKLNKVVSYVSDKQSFNSLIHSNITSVCCDATGALWIGTRGNGLHKLRYKDTSLQNVEFESVKLPKDSLNLLKNINDLAIDKKGNCWIGCDKGVYRYDTNSNQFTDHPTKINRLFANKKANVNVLHVAADGKLWLGTNNLGILIYNDKAKDYIHITHSFNMSNSLSSSNISSLTEDSVGNIWCGTTQDGLNKISLDEDGHIDIEVLQNNSQKENSLIDNDIRSVYFDKSGLLWVGTVGNGLNKVSFFPRYFDYYLTVGGNTAWTGPHGVSCIVEEDEQTIWIGSGTSGTGLYQYNRATGEVAYYSDKTKPTNISSPIVSAMAYSKKSGVWIGTNGGGLDNFDTKQNTTNHFRYDPRMKDWLRSNYISYIFIDSDEDYWLGTNSNNLHRIKWGEDESEIPEVTYYKKNNSSNSISGNSAYFIYEDKLGYIWISVPQKGVDRYDKKKNVFTNFRHDKNDPNSLSNNTVSGISEDANGDLWFATYGGLNRLNRDSGSFYHVTKEDGLPENIIYSMLSDDIGNLWIASRNLLSRFNVATENVKTFAKDYGLENCKFNFKSCYKCKNGELLFGTENKGVVHFFPQQINEKEHISKAIITNFKISNKDVPVGKSDNGRIILPQNISYLDEIELKYSDNVFSLEFASLNYYRQNEMKYAYKLDKVNKDWQYTDENNQGISYSNLSPGEYLFSVKAGWSGGDWKSEPTTLLIRILPPWWRTTWAYVLFMVIISGLVFFSWLYSIKRIKLKDQLRFERLEREKDNELNQLKLTFFTNISHEFRTPLTLLLGPLSKLKEKDEVLTSIERKKKYSLMHRNVSRLLQLINQLMDFRKIESGKLGNCLERGSIITFIKEVITPFEDLASQKQIHFKFESKVDDIWGWYDADKLEKIIFNLLSNAFKYTSKNESVNVSVSSSKGFIELIVTDTGVGIDEENLARIFERFYQEANSGATTSPGTGIGLALTKKLIQQLHGQIEVSSKKGRGSTFKVTLPYKKEAFTEEECVDKDLGSKKNELSCINGDFNDIEVGDDVHIQKQKKTLSGIKPIVLIIEDNVDVKDFIVESIEHSYRTLEAVNGKEGLQKCFKSMPDLVISDVMMPEMDGLEFCRRLKADTRTSHIPVVLLTAKTSIEQKLEGLDTGADAYITKPFDAEYLIKRVDKIIENRQTLRSVYQGKLKEVSAPKITTNQADEAFLNQVNQIIEINMTDSAFRVEDLHSQIGISRTHFFDKIKTLTKLSGRDYVRLVRLKKAADLLAEANLNVSEVAYAVGFADPKYFAKVFRKHFGVAPSKFTRNTVK